MGLIHLLARCDQGLLVKVVRQRESNSYVGNYRPGDFLLHLAGCPDRQQLMQHYGRLALPWSEARPGCWLESWAAW